MKPARGLGKKVRAVRVRTGMTQTALAERLQISPSYLNLIEHDRRTLTAPLLLRLARVLDIDLQSLALEEDARLAADLVEVFADPLFDDGGPAESDLRELAVTEPDVARGVVRLHDAFTAARSSARAMAEKTLDREDLPGMRSTNLSSELVTEFLQRHHNYFPSLEEKAERLWAEGGFQGEDLFAALSEYLSRRHEVSVAMEKAGDMPGTVRRFDPARRRLSLSEVLRRGSRNFQLAYQIALLECSDLLDRLVQDAALSSTESRVLGRVTLANYLAAALLMPYAPFLAAAEKEGYDLDLLQHRFRVNFEQVCHRLCTLQRPGATGVPFFMVRTDRAGNISKKFTANAVPFPRFEGLCPLRNVHAAFAHPNALRIQVSRLPEGVTFFSVARTIRKHRGGYRAPEILYAIELGCEIGHAHRLVYAEGMDLSRTAGAVPVGTRCRLCERMDCPARAFPSIQSRLVVDENVRGVSFFAPVSSAPPPDREP